MFKISIGKIQRIYAKGFSLLSAHWRQIAYYGAVLAVLCAVAYSAEVYRQRHGVEEIQTPVMETASVAEEALPEIIVPEHLRLLRGFDEEAVWNGELGQWERHPARDYAAENNCVYAFAEGEIAKIGKDSRWGNYMEIRSGELLLRYASVMAKDDAAEGDSVKAGERIGEIDGSMLREKHLGKHLHIEAYYKDKTVDFEAFMCENRKAISNS